MGTQANGTSVLITVLVISLLCSLFCWGQYPSPLSVESILKWHFAQHFTEHHEIKRKTLCFILLNVCESVCVCAHVCLNYKSQKVEINSSNLNSTSVFMKRALDRQKHGKYSPFALCFLGIITDHGLFTNIFKKPVNQVAG